MPDANETMSLYPGLPLLPALSSDVNYVWKVRHLRRRHFFERLYGFLRPMAPQILLREWAIDDFV
jgi:hypothetical protein